MDAASLIHISMNYFSSQQLGFGLSQTHTVSLHVFRHAAFRNCSCAKCMSPFEDRDDDGIFQNFNNTTFASF